MELFKITLATLNEVNWNVCSNGPLLYLSQIMKLHHYLCKEHWIFTKLSLTLDFCIRLYFFGDVTNIVQIFRDCIQSAFWWFTKRLKSENYFVEFGICLVHLLDYVHFLSITCPPCFIPQTHYCDLLSWNQILFVLINSSWHSSAK